MEIKKIVESKTVSLEKLEITFQDEKIQIQKLPQRAFSKDSIILTVGELEAVFNVVRSQNIVREFSPKKVGTK